MKGNVKWYSGRKGYGFISGEDNEEYFVHHTALPEGVQLNEGDKVEFEPAETERGKQAKDIKLLEE